MPQPPVAAKRPITTTHHGRTRVDEYDWLRDLDHPEVLPHLAAENAFARESVEHLEPLREAIFAEIKARTLETDLSVPVGLDGWWYYTRTTEGQQYGVQCRAPRSPGEPRPTLAPGQSAPGEQVLVDPNLESVGHDHFAIGACEVSVDGALLAYSVDRTGDERFDLVVRRIHDAEVLDTAVTDIGYGAVWSYDGCYLFYTRIDDAWRPHEVWRHEVGTSADADVRIHHEPDERFWVGLGTSKDDRWILIGAGSRTTSEVYLLDATQPLGIPRSVAPRRDGVEYDVDVAADRLLIVHNADHEDFDLAVAPLDACRADEWHGVGMRREGERLLGVDSFDTFALVSLRSGGLTALRVVEHDPTSPTTFGTEHDITPALDLYTIDSGVNPESGTTVITIAVESMVTPRAVYDYDVTTRQWTLLRQMPVLGGFDPADYVQHRLWATAPDGTDIPVSLVCRADLAPDGTHPGLLYGYGAYETSMDPSFSKAMLSMLDRGVVYAVAHVRGGGEMGRSWYEHGRLDRKGNSFDDFVACAEHLMSSGWVAPGRLAAEGASAGGLLMGAVYTRAPHLFAGVHAAVPFVDPLTTILDPSLPLTVIEWDEWGNPLHDPAAYDLIAGYSPYETVETLKTAPRLPALLVTTSVHDTRVLYAEPAKWVARLREVRPDARVAFKTELDGSHMGRSGRYDAWRQAAFEMAFLLDVVGAGTVTEPRS